MENSHVQAPYVDLMRRLSIWTKQLTLEWPSDWVAPGDLGRAADNSGWRSPVDRVTMMLGLIAEMYAHDLAENIIEESRTLPKSDDFKKICQGVLVDFSDSPPDGDWSFPFPAMGTVVLLQPTTLGLAVSDAVDPDIDSVTYDDRQPWIDQYVPDDRPEIRNILHPGAVARAVLKIGRRGHFGPQTFFTAAEKLGYEDRRDQAVAGFGALAQLVTTGAIIPGKVRSTTFVPDDWDMADIFADMAHWWFTGAEVPGLPPGDASDANERTDSSQRRAFLVSGNTLSQ